MRLSETALTRSRRALGFPRHARASATIRLVAGRGAFPIRFHRSQKAWRSLLSVPGEPSAQEECRRKETQRRVGRLSIACGTGARGAAPAHEPRRRAGF